MVVPRGVVTSFLDRSLPRGSWWMLPRTLTISMWWFRRRCGRSTERRVEHVLLGTGSWLLHCSNVTARIVSCQPGSQSSRSKNTPQDPEPFRRIGRRRPRPCSICCRQGKALASERCGAALGSGQARNTQRRSGRQPLPRCRPREGRRAAPCSQPDGARACVVCVNVCR